MKIKINAGELVEIHAAVTAEAVCDAAERRMLTLDDPGFCVVCGQEQDGCEPDARKYRCDSCGNRSVYGAEELLIMVCV